VTSWSNAAVWMWLAGCTGELPPDEDADGDGFAAAADCNDGDADVFPGAPERCNGVDDDCDEEVDEEAIDALELFADQDGDGYGDAARVERACAPFDGAVDDASDCDDTDVTVYPSAAELCDGLDNDCDAVVDAEVVPRDHPTIQDAIDALPDGSTVCLAPGLHFDPFDVSGRTIRIEGIERDETMVRLGYGLPHVLAEGEGTDATLARMTVSGLNTADPGLYGGFVRALDARVTLEDVHFTGHQVTSADANPASQAQGSLVGAGASDLRLVDVSLDGLQVNWSDVDGFGKIELRGGAFLSQGGSLTIEGLSVTGVTVTGVTSGDCDIEGAVLLADRGTRVTASDVTIEDVIINASCEGSPSFTGAVVQLDEATLDVDGLTVADVQVTTTVGDPFLLGVVYVGRSSGTMDDVVLRDNAVRVNAGTAWGTLHLRDNGELRVAHLTATNNRLSAFNPPDDDFSRGGGLYVQGPADLQWVDLRANRAASSGGAELVAQDGELSLRNAIVAGNQAVGTGGLFAAAATGPLVLDYVDIVGNIASADYGGLTISSNVDQLATVRHVNVVANRVTKWSLGGSGVYAFISGGLSWTRSNLFGNLGSDSEFLAGGAPVPDPADGNLAVDPLYVDRAAPDLRDWDLTLDPSSPVIDAGDPAVLDVDGTASDFGAYGGPDGDW